MSGRRHEANIFIDIALGDDTEDNDIGSLDVMEDRPDILSLDCSGEHGEVDPKLASNDISDPEELCDGVKDARLSENLLGESFWKSPERECRCLSIFPH